jgi:glycerol-3-phosphate O-acyltransferase
LVALAVLALGPNQARREDVRERVRELSRLFKFEFRFRADAPFEQIFQQTLDSMESLGELERRDEDVLPGPGRDGWSGAEWLAQYASILRNFVEGYRVAARSLVALLERPHTDKEMAKKALATGHHMFLDGEILRWEAVSKPIVSSAYSAFADLGYLVHRESKYHATPALASQGVVDDLEQRLVSFLPVRKS